MTKAQNILSPNDPCGNWDLHYLKKEYHTIIFSIQNFINFD